MKVLRIKLDYHCFQFVTKYIKILTGKWCDILDLIESTKQIGVQNSMTVLEGMVTYLRHKLLSSDTQTIYYTVLLLDVLVKNSGYRVHVLIGRKRFMKTLSVVARRNRLKSGYAFTRVSDLIIGK